MKLMKVGIIGTGLQANRRILSIEENEYSKVAAIAGLNHDEAAKLANKVNAKVFGNWKEIVENKNIDIVVICTPPHVHFEIASAALNAKKHVLCEKPLTRSSVDAQKLVDLSEANGVVFKCGFNHRHHPAMQKAHQLVKEGSIGVPITGRALYGICGRDECENEWRSDPKIVAGGQLLEQGIHTIDLFRWFVGDFDAVSAQVATMVFPIEPLEDTAAVLLHREDGLAVSINSSITQWRNRFRLELYGSEGYFEINGLGGSYDLQRIHIGKRDANAPFSEVVIDYRGGDKSWKAEWKHFMEVIINGKELIGSGEDGVMASRIVEAAYLSSKESRRVNLKVAVL